MRRLGRTGKPDANQAEIVVALRRLGWEVLTLSGQGYGCPDLVIWHPARQALRLVEVKRDKEGLTPAQTQLQARGWPVCIVRSVADAINL